MYDWIPSALQNTPSDQHELLFRQRHAIERLRALELRDRWGHVLEPRKLAAIAQFVHDNTDHSALGVRRREIGALVDVTDRLAMAMLSHEVPQFCSAPDTPAEDEQIETVVRKALNLVGGSWSWSS